MKGTVSVTELVQRDRIRDAQIALMKRGLSSTTISWDLSFEDGPISVERLLFDLANAMEKFLGEKPQSAAPTNNASWPEQKISRISDKAWESYKRENPWAERNYTGICLEVWGGVMLLEDEYRTLSELAIGSRLRSADDQAMAALDAENARLRQELNEMRASRDEYARRERQLHAKEQSRPADPPKSLGHIEPFPEIEPRDDSFPAPSHRPRYIPFL